MRLLVVLSCIALAVAKPSGFQAVSYSSPVALSSQYHAQDALGQYSYGYSAGTSAKAESKTYDGVVRGGYSYLDANGVVQTANYVADDVNGFQVAATGTVHDTPEVAVAKVAHAAEYNKAAFAAAAAPDAAVVVSAPASVVSSYAAPASVVTSYAAPAAVVVKEAYPSQVFSYSASPAVVSHVPAPVVTSYAAPAAKAFSYSTVAASPAVVSHVHAPAVTSYAAPAAVVVKEASPSKAFSYSSVAASPAVVSHVPSAVVTSYSAPAAVVVKEASPSKAFSYSTVAASPVSVVSSQQHYVHNQLVPAVSPVVAAAPAGVVSYSAVAPGTTSQQYHAQDELGQYTYGYSGGPSAKVETKTLDGVTRGGYSYVDGNGLVQSASYVADDANGFRVAATNVPVGPNSQVVPVVHQAVVDTPEVVAAKAAHFAAHAAAKSHDYYDY